MILHCVTRESGCCQCLEANERLSENCPGCIVGDQITNNLIKTVLVAESAGRAVLDEEHPNKRRVSGTCSLYEYMKPKSLVEVTDKIHGTYKGKLSKFAIHMDFGLRGQTSLRSSVEVVKVHE